MRCRCGGSAGGARAVLRRCLARSVQRGHHRRAQPGHRRDPVHHRRWRPGGRRPRRRRRAGGLQLWRAVPPLERGRILREAAAVLRRNGRELAALDALDGGNPVTAMPATWPSPRNRWSCSPGRDRFRPASYRTVMRWESVTSRSGGLHNPSLRCGMILRAGGGLGCSLPSILRLSDFSRALGGI